ncbi:MAG: hypothetical protein H0U82_09830 [Actinobacteria bacterium]|nr:hypothetical protein [Actinomycetota bacterium]
MRLDDDSVPILETYRGSREIAARLDIPRPSYECVRLLLHDARRQKARRQATRDTLIDIALYIKPIDALYSLD